MAYQTKIRRARFVLGPFTAEMMQGIGQAGLDSIKARILSGVNADDLPAKALTDKYAKSKVQRGRAPIRDWFWRGLTLGSLKVKSSNENRVVIGFVNAQADTIAHVQNLKERMFGISPNDRKAVNAAVLAALKRVGAVRFSKVA